jgi:hypothetical protein
MRPMVDVSRVLTNPRFLDSFDVYRRQQIVNNFGETKVSVQIVSGVRGVVYPASLNELNRRPESQMATKSIEVITRFAIRGESQTIDKIEFQPDILHWNGDSYLVVHVEDYSNYARGFVKVTCNSIDLVDLPTGPKDLSEQSPTVSGNNP